MKLKNVFVLLVGFLVVGCKTESISNEDNGEWQETLKSPVITLGYIEEPAEPYWQSCDSLLEEGWTCNVEVNLNIGNGTKAIVSIDEENIELYYTLNGTDPTIKSNKYSDGIIIPKACTLKVAAFDIHNKQKSEIISLDIKHPYGRNISPYSPQPITAIIGNQLCDVLIYYESLLDGSGADFTKQHFAVHIDDGNLLSGDGISSSGIFSFDTINQNQQCDKKLYSVIYAPRNIQTIRYTTGDSCRCFRVNN